MRDARRQSKAKQFRQEDDQSAAQNTRSLLIRISLASWLFWTGTSTYLSATPLIAKKKTLKLSHYHHSSRNQTKDIMKRPLLKVTLKMDQGYRSLRP